jgi:hypothetical protein
MLESRVRYAEERVDTLSAELSEWKEKYFGLYGENVELHRASAAKDIEIARLRSHVDHCPLAAQED